MRRLLIRGMAIAVAIAPEASAQDLGFVTSIFKEVNSITLFASFAEIKKSPELGTQSSQCLFLGVCGGGAEVLFDLNPAGKGVQLELGLGANYLRGFSGKQLPDSFDLRASIRSFPEFGAYLSGDLFGTSRLIPYAGGTFGLAELWNTQVYRADGKQVSLKGQTFSYGVVLGMAVSAGWAGNAFLEGGYKGRRFPGVEYGGEDPIPASWPRGLDMSGWQVALGWQFELKPEKGLPSLEGTWILASADGSILPATLRQVKNSDGTTSRTDVHGGSINLSNGSYALLLHERTVTFDNQARVVEIKVHDAAVGEKGAYRIAKNEIILTPDAATTGSGVFVRRLGEEIVITHVRPGHRLAFKKLPSS